SGAADNRSIARTGAPRNRSRRGRKTPTGSENVQVLSVHLIDSIIPGALSRSLIDVTWRLLTFRSRFGAQRLPVRPSTRCVESFPRGRKSTEPPQNQRARAQAATS